jgi:hypothetical protein
MRHMIVAPLSILFVSVLSSCAQSEKELPRNEAATAPNLVSLAATEYAFEAPDTIPAGWVTLQLANKGGEVHYGHIVQLELGKTPKEMVDAYAEAIRTSAARPKWVKRFGGPGGTAPGGSSSVTQYLEPGNYVWICPVEDDKGHPHFAKGEFKPFVVHASAPVPATRPPAPPSDVEVRLTDFSFSIDPALQPGQHTFRVVNTGLEPHDIVLMKLAPGRTLEDVQTLMNPERARRADAAQTPPLPFESVVTLVGGIAVIGPTYESFFDANVTAGEYAIVCMTTAPDGRSHIEHGMIKQVTVR